MWLFWCSYVYASALISAEMITLIKENEITCVLTADSVNSTIYVTNLDSSIIMNRTVVEINNIIDNDWTWTESSSDFRPVLDQRWTSFRKNNKLKINGSKKTFSICVRLNSTITVKDSSHQNETKITIGNLTLTDKDSSCQWQHYTIGVINNNTLNIRVFDLKNERSIYEKYLQFQPQWITIPEATNYKIHQYDFLYSKTISSRKESYINVTSLSCIALYVSVDEGCYLNMSVQPAGKIVTVHGFNEENNSKEWRKYEIRTEHSENEQKLSFYRGRNDGAAEGYWAIDDIHICSSQTVIYTTRLNNSWTNQMCMELNQTTTLNNTFCNNASLGTHCSIKCDAVLGSSYPNCEGHRICLSENNCHCAWGYKGQNCSEKCGMNSWGLDCKEQCMNCEECDLKIGCQKCKTMYFGTNCANEFPVVTKAPTLKSLTDDSIQLLINLEHGEIQTIPSSYIIQKRKLNSEKMFENLTTHAYPGDVKNSKHTIYLIRNTSYEIRTILISHNLSFQGDTVPILVINKKSLRGHFKDDDTLAITWSKPDNQAFDNYNIEYECQKTFCSNEPKTNYTVATETHTELTNMKHFKICTIKLSIAKDGNKELIDKTVMNFLNSSKSIQNRELPKNVTFSNNQVLLQLEESNIFSGPLNYSIKFKCISEWCTNEPPRNVSLQLSNYRAKPFIDLDGLVPFTDYYITVIASRSRQEERNQSYFGKTTPSKPSTVEDLSLYSSDDDNLYIRWKEPYPPRGSTEAYNVTLQSNKLSRTLNFSDCKIWKGFLCASTPRIKNVNDFNITIRAKNYDVSEWGPATNLTISIENVTGEPQNLRIALSPQSPKEIILSFQHPLYTYGTIDKFQTVLDDGKEKKHILTKVTDTINYTENITVEHGKVYNLSVWAQNGYDGKKASIQVIASQPDRNFSTHPFVIWCAQKCHLVIPKLKTKECMSYNNIRLEQNNENIRKKEGKTLNDNSENTVNCTETSSFCEIPLEWQNVANQTIFLKINNKTFSLKFRTIKSNIIPSKNDIIVIVAIVVSATLIVAILIGLTYFICKRQKHTLKKSKNIQTIKFSDLMNKPLMDTNQNNFSSRPIKINDFVNYFLTALDEDPDDNIISQQFEAVPKATVAECIEGRLKENLEKNRYINTLPYEDTRVVLLGNEDGDYINANFVDGYDAPQAFIATQAPLSSTVHDFWYMVWQENVKTIVMLTEIEENGCDKSEKYWPDDRSRFRFGGFLIESVSLKSTAHYIHREFQVICNKQIRLVDHFQYIAWPDHGVPRYTAEFVAFMKKIMKPQQNSPVVVHCNAGCGRTGTFILCDILIKMGIEEKQLDFVGALKRIRAQRAGLVSNLKQYIFSHYVLMEYFFGQDFSIATGENFEAEVLNALNDRNIKHINECLVKARAQYENTQFKKNIQLTDEEKSKNRFPGILPGYSQIYLPVSSSDKSNYINAVTVDCYQCPKKFIVTQQPLPNTVKDFWKLVHEYEIETILSLNKIVDRDPNCPRFWPNKCDASWTLGAMTFTFVGEETDNKTFSVISVKIGSTAKDKTRNVNIIEMKNWKRKTNQPSNIKDLIYVWQEIMTCRGQIIVTCYDGATASGLFVASAFLLEKVNLDHSCDVFAAVQNVRQSRVQFVEHPEQLKCLYHVAYEYIRGFSTYKNFD